MAARNEAFPWTSHYGHYEFFEEQMNRHGKVASLSPRGTGLYDLTRWQGDPLRVFICECYAFGVAEYMETVKRLGQIDSVIINSYWCGYSPEAKRFCRDARVGLFSIGEFMAALNRADYWSYLTDAEKEDFKKRGWL